MNVGTLLTKSARSFPDRLAIAYGDLEMSYQQVNEEQKITLLLGEQNVSMALSISRYGDIKEEILVGKDKYFRNDFRDDAF